MAAKCIGKSVRLSEEVFNLVNSRPEKGFNAKFEGMVLEFFRSAAERETTIRQLDKYIKQKQDELQAYITKCNRWYAVADQLLRVVNDVKQLETVSQKITGGA